MSVSKSLRDLGSFGEIAAEDDQVLLKYFLSTDAINNILSNQALLVLGRKGSGKTAIVSASDRRCSEEKLSLPQYA